MKWFCLLFSLLLGVASWTGLADGDVSIISAAPDRIDGYGRISTNTTSDNETVAKIRKTVGRPEMCAAVDFEAVTYGNLNSGCEFYVPEEDAVLWEEGR